MDHNKTNKGILKTMDTNVRLLRILEEGGNGTTSTITTGNGNTSTAVLCHVLQLLSQLCEGESSEARDHRRQLGDLGAVKPIVRLLVGEEGGGGNPHTLTLTPTFIHPHSHPNTHPHPYPHPNPSPLS